MPRPSPTSSMGCPMCGMAFTSGHSPDWRTTHVNAHFGKTPAAEIAQEEQITHTNIPCQSAPNSTAEMTSDSSVGISNRVRLCTPRVTFHSSLRADASWSCGYRNFQTLLSSLIHQLPELATRLHHQVPPVVDIQKYLEAAWKLGYDPVGAQQLQHQVVHTTKWIGATEVYCLLQSLNVDCHMIDFIGASGQGQTHPLLTDFVVQYYLGLLPRLPQSGASIRALLEANYGRVAAARQQQTRNASADPPVVLTDRLPLYLQHQGHSRTIIGYEYTPRGRVNLLVYDPEIMAHQYQRSTHNTTIPDVLHHVRLTPEMLARNGQYQIVMANLAEAHPNWDQHRIVHHYNIKLCRVP
ncbi:peptidase family C78-domain-containing protein [Dimargaris cristalligena]|uniref:Peptidase family C78-domain-containing protein n=1 Tax=Dimargaris cristalligena TaxID=215637 RepID=A0A4P9ZYP7_9FUNG|nr:peptidase family C78-domain-containing protein [Dimargaris cristalligena]|eukprot:RKP37900.1 peptidase family C78-domain-containing protein [Dimargaris cristalligena]